MRRIRKLGRRLLYGGFGGPKPYEAKVLEATVAALSERDAQALRQQIGLIERVQRWNEDRMVIVGFEDKTALEKLENGATDHCLAKLRLKGVSGSVTACVMTHRGILSSLEFRPSPRQLGDEDVSVELRELHAAASGEAAAIDTEEHA
jgi:hypothetical protein